MSNFLEAAKHTSQNNPESHQISAWNWAWTLLSKKEQDEFLAIFRGAPSARPAVSQQRPADTKKHPPYLLLTRTKQLDSRGLEKLKLSYIKDGGSAGSMIVVSGAPGAQRFRLGRDSRSGSLEPLPEGRWGIEDIQWASGRDSYSGSWGPGLGPVSTPLRYLGPGSTERSAIEIHIDSNARTSPGTAGCIGIADESDYRKLVGWLRDSNPRDLYVDYGLGSCQPPK